MCVESAAGAGVDAAVSGGVNVHVAVDDHVNRTWVTLTATWT